MSVKFLTVPSKRLAESITGSSSSFKLNNILGWDGVALAAVDMGTRMFAVLRNDANTLMEIVEIDPTTIASASITLLKRGLKFDGDLTTEVSGNKLTWIKNETIVELGSDVPQLLNHMVQIIGDQTIAGLKTFSTTPRSNGGTPTEDTELATKSYVDSAVSGSFPANRIVVGGNAGEAVVAGNLVYLDDTDNEWKLCDADTAATVENVILGIAQGAGSNGVAITNGVLLLGKDETNTGLTSGQVYYAGNTAGAIVSSPGTTEVNLGMGTPDGFLYFMPRFAHFITEDQQDALAGTSGTPSSTNKYVTNDDTSDAAVSGKIVRATGTALPALDASNLLNIPLTNNYVAGENITAKQAVSAGYYQADGGIIVDTSGSATGTVGTSGGTITQAITIANNTNRVLVVFLVTDGGATSNYVYNSVGMTKQTTELFNTTRKLDSYVLFAPGVGTHNFTIDLAATGSTNYWSITWYSIYNVTQAIESSSDMNATNSALTLTLTPTAQGATILSATAWQGTGDSTNRINHANNQQSQLQIYASIVSGLSGIIYPKKATIVSATAGQSYCAQCSLVLTPITTPTFTAVLKADASALANSCNLNKAEFFIGFASESKNAGETIKVNTSGLITGLSGLTPFYTYYLSDTDGAIATTAGTVSKKVGVAISTTELLIKHDNT